MNEHKCGCGCNDTATLIFSCSGAADVGAISDRTARKLSNDGIGAMYCLAGLGGHVNTMTLNTEAAGSILAIDGCQIDCARKVLEHAGITRLVHVRVTDHGYTKGKTPITDETVIHIASIGEKLLREGGCCS